MDIKTKFDLGQCVVKIFYTRKQIRIPCPECGGVSAIKTETGGKLICRKCEYAVMHGHLKGTIGSYEDSAWHIMNTGTVGRIGVTIYDYDGGDPDSDFDNYSPPKAGSDKEEYMLWETGVGSGSLHYADDLFATREEAQAECDRRNLEGKDEQA